MSTIDTSVHTQLSRLLHRLVEKQFTAGGDLFGTRSYRVSLDFKPKDGGFEKIVGITLRVWGVPVSVKGAAGSLEQAVNSAITRARRQVMRLQPGLN